MPDSASPPSPDEGALHTDSRLENRVPQRNPVLLLLIGASFLPILTHVALRGDGNWAQLLGSAIGQIGTLLLVWLQILGFRGLVGRFVPDWLWVSRIHRVLAISSVIFIACHPILMAAASDEPLTAFLIGGLSDPDELFLTLGKAALVIMAFAWLTSVWLRNRLGFRAWKRLHFVNYVVLPLVLLHSLNVGSSLEEGPLRAYWYVLAAIALALLVVRASYHAGVGQARCKVTEVVAVTHDTTRITFQPVSRALRPAPGQFIYVQTRRFGESHPFTVSHFDPQLGSAAITAKRLGPFTRELARLRPGDTVFLDGPYGVFTREAHTTAKPIVLVAGGIGITPFLSLLASWPRARGNGRHLTLFYGNKTLADIAYKQELERLAVAIPGGRIVHVLSQATAHSNGGVEHGFVDFNLLRRYLGESLARCEYFVCGPPPMMNGITRLLEQHGTPGDAVHTERFAV